MDKYNILKKLIIENGPNSTHMSQRKARDISAWPYIYRCLIFVVRYEAL